MADILIVEDEKALNEAYKIVLERQGHKVTTAFDGEQGLDIFKKKPPQLVLLDLRLPKIDGVEFLRKLNAPQNYPKTTIIIFSNYDDQEEVDKAFKSGASRYILKAWSSPHELVKIVDETLKKK